MSKPFRATRVFAGVTLSGEARTGLMKKEPRRRQARRGAVATRSADESSLWIEEPLRFHLARYERFTNLLHGRFNLAAALLSCVILIMLGWRAVGGEYISPERWLYGLLSGWFIVLMTRLALFTCLAAPRGICYAQGRLRISGLGTLRAEQVLHWSIQRGVRISSDAIPGVRLQIHCRWCGCERHWMMLMEEGQEAERLQQLLEVHLPRNPHPATTLPLHRTIQIEAGILSQ